MRMIQTAASGATLYWWAALPVLVIGWAFWKMFRRGLVAKKSGYPAESQPYRDVTDSAQNPSEKK